MKVLFFRRNVQTFLFHHTIYYLLNLINILCTVTDDPYYCGLRARVPNFAKEKVTRKTSRANEEIYVSNSRNVNRIPRDPVIKRRSIAHMDRHQPTFSSLYQLNQINDPRSSLYQRLHHHSYNLMSPLRQYGMWHARSYESGIGEAQLVTYFMTFFISFDTNK